MPITKSAKKALRASRRKRAQNNKLRLSLELALKYATLKNFSNVVSKVDKAAKNNILSKNKAARIKSRLAKKIGAKGVTKRAASVPAPDKPKSAVLRTANKTTVKTAKKKA